MAATAPQIDFALPAGPVANAYEQSQARVSVIIGPTGGGKTVSSAKKCLRVAQWQQPSPRDGIRKARVICVTPDYRAAWRTVIPSFTQTMRPYAQVSKFLGSKGDPLDFHLRARIPGMGPIDLQVHFRAVGDENLEEFMRGLETTAWWFPEMDTQPEDLVALALNRVGRYPPPDERPEGGGLAYAGVFGDANVPDIDSWFYERFWLPSGQKDGWHVFRQPDGFSPQAENIANLHKIDPRYYENMAKDMDPWAVRRFIRCLPGYSRHGTPVHPDFDTERHVSRTQIPADPTRTVVWGVDGGGNTLMPGAVCGQDDYLGRSRILAEFAPTAQHDVQELGAAITKTMNTRIRRARGAVIFIDPAAGVRSPLARFNYGQQLQAATGIEVRPAPSNAPALRRGALKRKLQAIIGGEPAYLVDGTECPHLIRALAGGWSILKTATAKGVGLPDKGQHSHIAEAAEYREMGASGIEGLYEPDGDIGPEGVGHWREPELVL